MKSKQLNFEKTNWKFRYNHGGVLRQKRLGRKARPLSSGVPIHLVLKTNKNILRRGLRSQLGFFIVNQIIKKYALRFYVKIEQLSVNHDHIHLLIRFTKRSNAQSFLRVVSGQIAQQFQKNGFIKVTDALRKAKLWKFRPFTRVVFGWKPYQIVRNYIQLNEKEASGLISYKTRRLKGLSLAEWETLWS